MLDFVGKIANYSIISRYIFLVKTSTQATIVDVIKYVPSISLNLYLVLIKKNYFVYKLSDVKHRSGDLR